jgi:hypothetical protein
VVETTGLENRRPLRGPRVRISPPPPVQARRTTCRKDDLDRAHDGDGIRHARRMDLVALGTATAVVSGRPSSGNTAEKQQESSIKRSTGMTNVHQKVRSCLFSCRASGRVGATPP